MRYRLFFLAIALLALKGVGQKDTAKKVLQQVFEPVDRIYYSPLQNKLISIPEIKYKFKEVYDSSLLSESKKKIFSNTKYKNAPYNFKGMYFANPSLQSENILSSLKKGKSIEALRYYIDSTTFRFDKEKCQASVNTIIPLDKLFRPFYFKESEVTNEEYGEFVRYVLDSIARHLLYENYSGHEADFGYIKNDTFHLNRKKPVPWDSNNQDVKDALQPLYLPVYQRYYNSKELDTRKLNWKYYFQLTKEDAERRARKSFDDSTIKKLNPAIKTWSELFTAYPKDFEQQKDIINVYPDTLSWVHDFAISNFEASTNMYNWHPAYKTHPVTGVSYLQARAFLIWKTQRLQEELDKKNILLKVECDFPTAIEWEMMSTANKTGDERRYFSGRISRDLRTNLEYEKFQGVLRDSVLPTKAKGGTSGVLSFSEGSDDPTTTKLFYDAPMRSKQLTEKLMENFQNLSHYVFPTAYTDDKIKINPKRFEWDKTDLETSQQYRSLLTKKDFVSFLNGNVSEWMSEQLTQNLDFNDKNFYYHPNWSKWSREYEGSYEPIYSLYLKMLKSYDSPDTKEYIAELEKNFKEKVKTARLVQGANFYDMGDIINGANKFTFVAEDSAHAAIGFRYVIRFTEKTK